MKKVLIVDDSTFMRMIIKKLLKNEEVEISEASNGREGVEKFKEVNPDLVTLDITMPDMDGIHALREIIRFDNEAKVIMCSSMVYKDNVEEAKEVGAVEFVLKPFKDEEMLKIIKKYL